MNASRLRTLLIAFLCGTSFLYADILVLKNGTRMEGNILEETPEAVRMRYRLTPKIWDEKSVPRADIQQVIKQRPEEIEIVELRKLLPTPDLLTADKYEQIIQNQLRPFANKYKGTAEAEEAEKMITELQDEKTKVANGGAKIEGRWLTAEEAKRNDYDIKAYKLLTNIRAKAAAEDWVGALREFDKFQDARYGFPASVYYVNAIEEALKILDKYEPLVSGMAAEQPTVTKQRDEGIKKLVEPDLSRTRKAITQETSTWRATYTSEQRQGIRWRTLNKYDLRSLQDAQNLAVSERSRLQSYDLEALRTQNKAFGEVLRAIAAEDYNGAIPLMMAAEKMPPANAREFQIIVNDIRSRMGALRAKLMQRMASGVGLANQQTAAAGTPGTGIDDRVAQILQQQQAGAAAQQPGVMPQQPGVMPQQPGAAPRPAVAPVSGTMPAPAPVAPAPVYEEDNFKTYLLIGAGVVIVLLLVLLVSKKK